MPRGRQPKPFCGRNHDRALHGFRDKDGRSGCRECVREYNRARRRREQRAVEMERLLREGIEAKAYQVAAWKRKAWAFISDKGAA